MADLADLKQRVLNILGDPDGERFSDAQLEEALRQALAGCSQSQPLTQEADATLTIAGREQVLEDIGVPLYVLHVWRPAAEPRQMVPFQYYVRGSDPVLVLGGAEPQAGDTLHLRYAMRLTIDGLAGETETNLPEHCESILVRGAAGYAAFLRLGHVSEVYGQRNSEAAQLLALANHWLNDFRSALEDLRTAGVTQAYLPGFDADGAAA